MAIHDFYSRVRARTRPPLKLEQIPAREELFRRADAVDEIVHQELDLRPVDPAGRQKLGPVTTPEEIEINGLYVGLCRDVPFLLEWLGEEPTIMADAYQLDLSLIQVQGALEGLRARSGTAVRFLEAELTHVNDRFEDAIDQYVSDPQYTEMERDAVQSFFKLAGLAHTFDAEQRKARRERMERRVKRLRAQVLAAKAKAQVQARLESLKNTPALPVGQGEPKRRGRKRRVQPPTSLQ